MIMLFFINVVEDCIFLKFWVKVSDNDEMILWYVGYWNLDMGVKSY